MKKFLFFLIIIVFICIAFKFFSNDTSVSESISESNFYINIFNPKSLTNTFYQYDPRKNKSKTLLSKNMEDYTSFAYSEDNNKLYFADGTTDNTIQLFENDLNTNQTKQLTIEFSSVDYIQIDKEQKILFLRVLLRDEYKNFHIATYNLQTHKLEIWGEENKDRSILDFNYNPNNNKLIVVSYSEKEDTEKLEKANNNHKLQPPKYSLDIYNIQGQKMKHIDTIEKFISGASLAPDNSSVIVSYDEDINSSISHVVEMDIESNNMKPLLDSNGSYSKIRSVKFDEKKEGFYFLSSFIDEKKDYSVMEVPKESMLSYYDLRKNEIRNVWKAEESVIVNYSGENF